MKEGEFTGEQWSQIRLVKQKAGSKLGESPTDFSRSESYAQRWLERAEGWKQRREMPVGSLSQRAEAEGPEQAESW